MRAYEVAAFLAVTKKVNESYVTSDTYIIDFGTRGTFQLYILVFIMY